MSGELRKANDVPLFGLATDCSSPLLGVFTNNNHTGLIIRWKSAAAGGENTNNGD